MTPVAPHERYASLDILRGTALFGVLIVNLLGAFRIPPAAHILEAGNNAGAVETLVSALIEFKAFSIFSFLFGVGVAVQSERFAGQHGPFFLARRFLILLAIGLVHMLLVWNGDILTLYSVCGLILIPALWLPDAILVVAGMLAIVVPHLVSIPIPFPDRETLRMLADGASRTYTRGSFREILAFRWHETGILIVPLLLLSLPKTFGLILLGVAAWRRRLFDGRRRFWTTLLVICAATCIAGTLLHADVAAHVPLAFAYTAAILLWLPRAPLLAAGGQMALTNYLAQSIVFGFVFYSYGLGLFGRLGAGAAAAFGVVLYAAQLAFSRWWLSRYAFGPCEWLWRSLAYGRSQPMLKKGMMTVSHPGLRAMLMGVFLLVMPLVHIGIPWLLSRIGSQWGWTVAGPNRLNLLGLLPIGAGLALIVWILTTMLSVVSSLPERVPIGWRPARLIQCGPYAHMRHPIYLAEGLMWTGCALFFGSPLVLAVFAGMAAFGAVFVIRIEERKLEEYFGDEYRAYKRCVPALPFLKARSPNEKGGN